MANLATRILAIVLLLFISDAATAATKSRVTHAKPTHRLLIQVDQNDPETMNLALNNAANVIEYYRGRGEQANIDIVAFGPGLHMLRADTSPVSGRIKGMKDMAFPGTLHFSACTVTKKGMEKKEGKPITMLPEASAVPSGVAHMVEMQEKGWSYVRP